MLAAAILAAGESRRMGVPKALLDYRGKTFTAHLLDVTLHPRVGLRCVVLGARAEEIRARLQIAPSAIVINADWRTGQLSSIQAAIRSLPESAIEALLLCPVDHPLISSETVRRLIAAFDAGPHAIVVPTYRGRRGHPVLFRSSLFAELLAASPEVGARQVVWAHAGEVAEVPVEEEGVLLNLDDREAYRKAIHGS